MSWKGGGYAARLGGPPLNAARPVGPSAIKPVAASAPTVAVPKAVGGKKPVLTVATNSKKEDIGVHTLVGDYEEAGTNHGKKYYKKIQAIKGHEGVNVFLYYWDNRDGADNSGYWFGDELGGSQVWARCNSHGNAPPVAGWKFPWDALKPEPGLLTVGPYKAPSNTAAAPLKPEPPKQAPGGKALGKQSNGSNGAGALDGGKALGKQSNGSNGAGAEDKIRKMTAELDSLETAAKEIVSHAKSLTDKAEVEVLKETVESLQQHNKQLLDFQKTLNEGIAEARKGGPAGNPIVIALSKLTPKLRVTTSSVSTELNRTKGFVAVATRKEEEAKKVAASQAKEKEQEEKQQQELDETLPVVQEMVEAAEDAVEAVGIMASPIMSDPPDDAGDSMKHILDEIEAAANDAQNKLTEARQSINSKLQVARNYTPEIRKKALADFTAMQQKLGDAQKRLSPFKSFKREFAQRVEAKKAVQEIAEKLTEVELEVEKASMISAGAEGGAQMSEEDVKSAEGLVKPAQTGLATVGSMVDSKLRGASGPMKDELTELKTRLAEFKQTLEKVDSVLKVQREGVTLQTIYATANEKIDKAEQAFEKCGDAELIFLKGIEVLPKDESEQAIKDSEAAAGETSREVSSAKGFLKSKMIEVKRFSKESQEAASQELKEMEKRCEELEKKVASFKSETQDRKVSAMMSEAVDGVVKAEVKGKNLTDAAKIFESDNLEGTTPTLLREAVEKTATADKECISAIANARSVIAAKQKDARDKEIIQALSKLTQRIGAVQQEATKMKRIAATGDKLAKCLEVVSDGETKLKEVEAEVEKLVRMSKPEDEGLGVEKVTDETVMKLDEMSASTAKSLKTVTALVSTNLSTAPPAIKGTLTKLAERCKAAQVKVGEVQAGTKEQRERVLSESYVKEAETKTKEVEATLEKAGEAEAPYLKGMEVLPLEEAQSSLTACEECASKVQDAISAARDYIATKNLEVKRYDPKSAKPSIDEFVKLTERVNAGAQKLGMFKKDMENRKKKALVQEAITAVTGVETEVEKVKDAMKPIMEKDPDEMSTEEASAMMKSLDTAEMSAQSQASACSVMLRARARDARADVDKVNQIKELETRLAQARTELAKAKKLGSTNNEKIMAKALVQEVADKLKAAEERVDKAESSSAPLLEEKCEPFLVKNSLRTLSSALLAHMDEKKLSEDEVYKMMGEPLNQVNFVEFVGKMPDALQRDECLFTDERRAAMFKKADVDGDEVISIDEFKLMLASRYIVSQTISVTDVLDIKTSKTVCKLEKGDAVQAIGASQLAEDGVKRIKCKIISSGEEGWVTLQGNSGKEYLETASPFKDFTNELRASLESTYQANNKVLNFFIQKYKEMAVVGKDSHPHLATSKQALGDAKTKMSKLIGRFDKIQKDVEEAIKGYAALEAKENNAHIEAKERKAAEAILVVARPLMTSLEAEVSKLDDATKPLLERYDTDLLASFATPLTVLEEATKLCETVRSATDEAKKIVRQQVEQCRQVVKGPMLDAKKQLNVWAQECVRNATASNKKLDLVQKCCTAIATAKIQVVAGAMRSSIKTKNVSLEAHFSELAAGADKIPEDCFCSYVQGIDGVELSTEHAKLLVRHIEADGIGRRSFLRFLQQYFKVVQGIALTPTFDVIDSKEKPVRKVDIDEILELLEGPTTDEKSGLARVRVRAIFDGAEGWMTVKGNQGKVYLDSAEKPFLSCLKEVALEKNFEAGTGDTITTLKADEVIELIEGPRKETLGTATRARVKVAKDGKTGWLTLKDKQGNEIAEKSSKCYTCTASVAITDAFDIKACKVVRKLAVDEVFTVEEGPIVHEESGISRAKGKCDKDGIEGWVTISGNAGTVYAKLNAKLYTVSKEVALTEQFSSSSKEIRRLAVDEAFEVLEGPKEEKTPAVERAKVRTSADVVGWITFKSGIVASWSPTYQFTEAGSLYSAKGNKESIVREAVKGEKMELLEGPMEVDGEMWMKCSMKKDGAVGWVPMKNKANLKE